MEFSEQDYKIRATELKKSRKVTISKNVPLGTTIFIIIRKDDGGD